MKYNSIGEQLITKAQELDSNYKPDKFNDMSEAIDVILKSVGFATSVFDITPYLTSETSMSIEGYNALKEFITSNKGGMVKVALGSSGILYFNCTSISNNNVINLSQCEFAGYEGTIRNVSLGNDGVVAPDGSDFVRVIPNASNPTSILTTIGIGGSVYSIPVGEDYSTEISTLNSRVDSLNNDVAQLLGYNIYSLDSRITQLEGNSSNYVDSGTFSELSSRVNDLEKTIIKEIPPLPNDASTKTYVLKSINGVLTWSE